MASAYLTRTPSSSGNLRTWTFSAWFKKGSGGYLLGAGDMSDGDPSVAVEVGSTIEFRIYSGGHISRLIPTQVTRDNSAWYHYVVAVDTTQATASNRVKVYINGTQVTSFSTEEYMTQNYDTMVNSSSYAQRVGDRGSGQFDGCMAHVHLTDGTQYQASDFGETDSTSGIWKPKTSPSVTYGTNGFFLKFENSGAMGTDSSGNGNNFTVSGTITQTEDTPSNNFATLNAVYKAAYQPTFSTGNLTATAPNSGQYYPAFSSLGIETGKFYMEYKIGAAGTFHIGISSQSDTDTSFNVNDRYMGETSKSVGIADSNGSYYISGSATSYGSSYTSGDIIGLALDMTNKKLYVSKNGTFFNSADPASGTGGIDISGILSSGDIAFFAHSCYGGTGTRAIEANFGNGRFGTTALASSNSDSAGLGLFEYSVPSGYYALCTKNIKNYG